MKTAWLLTLTIVTVPAACSSGPEENYGFSKLADVYAEPNAQVVACQNALEPVKCSGPVCATLSQMNDAAGLTMSPEHPRKYQYGTNGFAQMIRHAAGITKCISAAWTSNGKNIVVGDVADENAATPLNRHPGGSHNGGVNADISYYQLTYDNNLMRPVCPHEDNHCTAAPKYLDPYKTAVFVAGLHRHDLLQLIGVDGQIGKPLINATKDLCKRGVIKGNACRGLKLVFEETNQGNGWYAFHHHHMHVRLGSKTSSNFVTINEGSTDNNASWYDPAQPGNPTTTGETADPAVTGPVAPEKPAEQAEQCFVGFLKTKDNKRLCSAWQGKDGGTLVKTFVRYTTDECNIAVLGVHLQRDDYNALVTQCNGKYTPHADEGVTPGPSNDIYVALPEDNSSSVQTLVLATDVNAVDSWICPGHDIQNCLSAEMTEKLIRTDRITSPATRIFRRSRTSFDIREFTVFSKNTDGGIGYRKIKMNFN